MRARDWYHSSRSSAPNSGGKGAEANLSLSRQQDHRHRPSPGRGQQSCLPALASVVTALSEGRDGGKTGDQMARQFPLLAVALALFVALAAPAALAAGITQLTGDPSYYSLSPSISADGRVVAFSSSADLVLGGNPDGRAQVFLYNGCSVSLNVTDGWGVPKDTFRRGQTTYVSATFTNGSDASVHVHSFLFSVYAPNGSLVRTSEYPAGWDVAPGEARTTNRGQQVQIPGSAALGDYLGKVEAKDLAGLTIASDTQTVTVTQ